MLRHLMMPLNAADTTFEEKDNSAREKWCKQFPVQQKGDTRKNTLFQKVLRKTFWKRMFAKPCL